MRITTTQHQAAVADLKKRFGECSRVWLFGSRVDDDKRGGDVDLYVEAEHGPSSGRAMQKIDAVVALEAIFDDQSVDLVVKYPDEEETAIHRIAKATGVPL